MKITLTHLVQFLFILFNIVMLAWLTCSIINIYNYTNNSYNIHKEVIPSITGIGISMGVGLLVCFWAAGNVIISSFMFFIYCDKKLNS